MVVEEATTFLAGPMDPGVIVLVGVGANAAAD